MIFSSSKQKMLNKILGILTSCFAEGGVRRLQSHNAFSKLTLKNQKNQ
jgi:hypothetical protein